MGYSSKYIENLKVIGKSKYLLVLETWVNRNSIN